MAARDGSEGENQADEHTRRCDGARQEAA